MKRFGSLRRSKKRKEQDGLGGRNQSEASCLFGNLSYLSECQVYVMIPYALAKQGEFRGTNSFVFSRNQI